MPKTVTPTSTDTTSKTEKNSAPVAAVYRAKNSISRSRQRVNSFISARPFATFLIALTLLFGLIFVSDSLSAPDAATVTPEAPVKSVKTFTIGGQPSITAQAQVKKTGVATITAQTGGVVQKIYHKPGQRVNRGSTLVWIATNYVGGTLSSVARKQAQTNYDFTKDNLEKNKEMIANQRRLAELGRDNTEQLRSISSNSVGETKDLLAQNNRIMDRINESIKPLELIVNPSDTEQTQLTQLLSQKAQLQSGINQLNSGLRATEYQVDTNKPPTQLADAQRDLTYKQLDLQEKSLELQEKLGALALLSARIGESLNFPGAPFTGTVDKINVVPGQVVNPGEVLAIVTADKLSATAEVTVPQNMAQQVSMVEPSTITFNGESYELMPTFVSSQPTNGSLYSIIFQLPETLASAVPNNGYLQLDLSLGMNMPKSEEIFVPLDSIYQSQEGAYVYVVDSSDGNSVARVRQLRLSQVIGNFVQVTEGLHKGDIVILDRTVLEGSKIKTE